MLYKRKDEKRLDPKLFEDPSSEYRGFPFWAWNGKVDDGEVVSQVGIFKEMGFGGFHMHVRQGLETEYLGKGFMNTVKECVQKAKELDLYACLYDEDRWPSGAAGGLLTSDKRYRQRHLLMTASPLSEELAKEILLEKEIEILISVGDGDGCAVAWGCDLTYDYVKINGDYRT